MKGYTQSPVKKRADGRSSDPYLAKIPPEDRAICSHCGAIYHNKHWSIRSHPALAATGMLTPPSGAKLKSVLCPACQKIRDHFPSGVITLRGDYLERHRQEIVNLVHNEEKRAIGFNPLERILAMRDHNGDLEVETTTEKLAQRIGKRLHHAHQGSVRYKWSRDSRFIRVLWERNE